MNIAIVGTGNVGGALAAKWAKAGHKVFLGVRDQSVFKGQELLEIPGISAHPTAIAVANAEVVLMAVPAPVVVETTKSLGDTSGKVIIDAMNIVGGRGPSGFDNTADAILANTQTRDVVKCFNTTGYNNMIDPNYGDQQIDLFTCGDSERGKKVAIQLALDAGFGACYDIGGNDKFRLQEEFAWFWINLAMVQGQGREIGFKLLKRS